MSVTNPYTGRKIQRGGKVHRKLQKGGVLTEEEKAFIVFHNKKAQFKRAIERLPLREQAGYEMHLEDPNFARHLRDAESDVRIHTERDGYPLNHVGGFSLFGNKYQNLDLDTLSSEDLRMVVKIINDEKKNSHIARLLTLLDKNSKYGKRLAKHLNETDKILSEMENEANKLM